MAQNNNTNTSQVSGAEKVSLLQQSQQFEPLAANAEAEPTAAPPAGWTVVASTDPPKSADTYGLFAKIYERTGPVLPGQTKYAIAFRGTDKFSDFSDMTSDADIALRRLPDQYWKGLEFVEQTCEKNNINPADVTFTGHSLGGYLARTIGITLGAKHIWTFNAPGPPDRIEQQLEHQIPGISAPAGNGLVQIRSADDLVSAWGYKNDGITISVNTAGSPHGLANLNQAITETIKNEPITPVAAAPHKRRFLSAIFGAVTKVTEKLALSKDTNSDIARMMDTGVQNTVRAKPPTGPS